jgi:hypothetical protein
MVNIVTNYTNFIINKWVIIIYKVVISEVVKWCKLAIISMDWLFSFDLVDLDINRTSFTISLNDKFKKANQI